MRSPFLVAFAVRGMGVVLAGKALAGSGHHHLLIDTPLPRNVGEMIRASDTHKHYGKGQTMTPIDQPPRSRPDQAADLPVDLPLDRPAGWAAEPPPGAVPKLLLTGFEPFDGEAVNPSWAVAQALHGERVGAARVVALQLPCVFATALPVLQAALAAQRPQWVVALGLAGSRSAISIERVAVNLIDARIPDNAGAQPLDQPVVAGGPAAYFTRLPAKALVARLQQAGLAAELSHSAGSFVCNQVFYGLMHALDQRPGVVGGFIHLPPLPEQAAQHPASRTMALADQVRGLRWVSELLVAGTAELRVAGGRID